MSSVLLPSVAGSFYPSAPQQLAQQVDSYLAEVPPLAAAPPPKALIAPHAGYIYSGPVAAHAYAALAPAAKQIQRVVLFAPAHRIPFNGIATTSADRLRTPLGDIAVDDAAWQTALQLSPVVTFDEAFAGEHALEVQLPFLQRVLDNFSIVPFIVGNARAEDVQAVINHLWGGPETIFVISSDLSHYLDYASARDKDAHTTQAIESLDWTHIGFDDACGRIPVAGMLRAAAQHGLQAHTLDLRNSGDTAGDKSRVVGYGAYVFN